MRVGGLAGHRGYHRATYLLKRRILFEIDEVLASTKGSSTDLYVALLSRASCLYATEE